METFLTVLPFLVALTIGLTLTDGFHVSYKANTRNRGLVTLAPWRTRATAAIADALGHALAWLTAFVNARPGLIAAALVLVLCVAHPGTADAFSAVALIGAVDTTLQREYEHAVDQALTLKARDADPGTQAEALTRVLSLRTRVLAARSDAAMSDQMTRLTAGLKVNRSPGGIGRGLGQAFIDSDTFKWLSANRGKLPSGQWTSPSSELPGFNTLMGATLTEDAASGGDLVVTDYQAGILPLPSRPLTIADLLAPGTTESNSVGYMKETTATNAAATVAEGAAKPESTLIFDAVSDPVRKIATWIPVTEEMLEDVPAIRAYLDTRLRLFVQLVEDDQLLNGDGTAPNISGILDRAGIAAPIARVAETNPDVILKQISAIEAATQLPVDGVVMHPTNWDALLLLKDADGNYIAGGGPFATPQRKTLWGRNVAVTTAVTVNTAVVGAWKTAAQFFRRGGLRVESSNAHSDFFIKNLVAIRAEERGALCVYRESAFGKVTNLN